MPASQNHNPGACAPTGHPAITRLSGLHRGDLATVSEVDGQQPRLLARLAARGLVPGAALRVLQAGDPMLIAMEGSRWAMARADAEHVHIEPVQRSLRRRLLGLLLP